MNRLLLTSLLSLAAWIGTINPIWGQNIVVRDKPGEGQWTVWYTRMMDRDDTGGELSGGFATLAAAKQHAAGLQRWSQSMQPPTTTWKLRTIFIEGEDAVNSKPGANAAPKTQGLFAAVQDKVERDEQLQESLKKLGVGKTETGKFAADLLSNPDQTLTKDLLKKGLESAIGEAEGIAKQKLEEKAADLLAKPNLGLMDAMKGKFDDYLSNVQDAYKRASDAKNELLGLTGTLAEKKFGEVNALVDRFNKESANTPEGLKPIAGLFPKMTPVGPDTLKAAEEWRQAVGTQFELEAKKARLDTTKAELDRERADIVAEWKQLTEGNAALDPADPRVVRLQKRVNDLKEGTTRYMTDLSDYRTRVERLQDSAARMAPSPGSDSLVGAWIYPGDPRERAVFTIRADGTAVASAYFANSGTCKIQTTGDRLEIVIPANWGPFSGKPYLKWSMRRVGNELVGTHTWYQGDGMGWDKPAELRLVKKKP